MSASSLLAAPSALSSARAHHAHGKLIAAAEGYREVLESEPESRDALLGLSLIARQSRQALPALRMAEAALAAHSASDSNANLALAWANFGDCVLPYDQDASEAAYRQAILLERDLAAAHYGLGNILALRENYADALDGYERAILMAPRIAEFHFAAAFALGKLGRHTEAVAGYRRAVHLQPNFASAWLNLGVELIADGQDSLTELCYLQALTSAPGPESSHLHTRISAQINLGNFKRSRRYFPEAQQHYEHALELTPEGHARVAEVQVAFAYLHLEQEHFADAWKALELAAAAEDRKDSRGGAQDAEIANARGIVLLAEHSAQDGLSKVLWHDLLQSAIEAFGLAESLGHKAAASNRGNALLRLGRVSEAIGAHRKALMLDPHHAGIRYNLALTQLRGGLFLEGWHNYEVRWRFREVHPHPRRFAQPRWEGEALDSDSRLLIYAEQGLGDTLQFHRYLAMVIERLPEVGIVLEVQPALKRLLEPVTAGLSSAKSNLSIKLVSIEVIAHGDPLPHFSHHCPLMSLPAIFGTTVETVPPPLPILELDPELISQHVEELNRLYGERMLRIGINWAGNRNYRADRERSTQLSTFLRLLRMPDAVWVSLQKGVAAEQIGDIQKTLPCGCSLYDACSDDRDLADSAAWIGCLDLVITTDSAIAHLAGCMAKPVWLLLPWQSDWRWMQEIETTPWYPTARLFRQSSPHNWPELIDRVAGEIQLLLQSKSGQAYGAIV